MKIKKKEPFGSVGIKNSWKYEKDLIILNKKYKIWAISRLDNLKMNIVCGEIIKVRLKRRNKCILYTLSSNINQN